MMDAAIADRDFALVHDEEKRAKVLRRFRRDDLIFRTVTQVAAVTVLALLAGVILALAKGSLPTWRAFGLDFFTSESWNPVTEKFGALPAIYGTLLTSIIAMLIGVPVSLGIAIFLTEICPQSLRRTIGTAIELLAGIPSIIYGIWGLFVFAPWFQVHVQPLLIDTFSNIPILNQLFAGPPYGIGLLTAGLILAVMVLPLVTSITREVFDTVPPVLKEAAYGIGCTRWEVMRRVVIPYTRVGIIGAVMLGLGRALGETMAVTFVIGNDHNISPSLFAAANSIASTLANEFTEASEPLYLSALVELGLVLFVITLLIQIVAQLWLRHLNKLAGVL
jgi:phosphate transport system permease protein